MSVLRSKLLLVLTALIAVQAAAAPPEEKPLVGPSLKEGEPGPQLFYYGRKGRKIYLLDGGQALAQVPEPEAPAVQKRLLKIPKGEPLAAVAADLAAEKVVLIDTSGPAGILGLDPKLFPVVFPVVLAKQEPPAPGTPPPPSTSKMLLTDRISVVFSDKADEKAYETRFGISSVDQSGGNGHVFVSAKAPFAFHEVLAVANAIYEHGTKTKPPEVLSSHPDFIPLMKKSALIEDPRFVDQWHLDNKGQPCCDIGAMEAWSLVTPQAGVRVAVIDDAVESVHPDLKEAFVGGWRFEFSRFDPLGSPDPLSPSEDHGTCCAGVALARANKIGVRGVAPGCSLLAVATWGAASSQFRRAIFLCEKRGAAVLSCSWSLDGDVEDIGLAIEQVARTGRGGKGCIVVFSAGNAYRLVAYDQYFGTLDGVICVGATDHRDDFAGYSNFGPEISVVAPGGGDLSAVGSDPPPAIVTTDLTDAAGAKRGREIGDYTSAVGERPFGGTSAACPQVAGIAALILSANPTLSAVQVRSILEHTADRVLGSVTVAKYDPVTSHDIRYGYGRVHAGRAVRVALASKARPDAVWPAPPRNLSVSTVAGKVRVSWENPSDDFEGVILVRSSASLRWRPHDGDRFFGNEPVGDSAANGVILARGQMNRFDDASAPAGAIYSLFAFNRDFLYSWGVVARRGP